LGTVKKEVRAKELLVISALVNYHRCSRRSSLLGTMCMPRGVAMRSLGSFVDFPVVQGDEWIGCEREMEGAPGWSEGHTLVVVETRVSS
jgi:hypothetical protein